MRTIIDPKKKKPVIADKILEALRDFGGIPDDTDKIHTPEKTPQEELPREFRPEWQIQRQEKLIFSHKEQETQLQVKAILEELKKLAQSTGNLAQEVKMATAQVPVEPGIYHQNFFEKLRQTIALFRQRIDESATWLAAFSQKAKKHNYWAQVRKSGTQFMLSSERTASTSIG